MIEIESSRLTLDLVPGPEAGYEEIYDFAQTYDGYKHYGSPQNFEQIVRLKGFKTLDDLRADLFFLQRAWHWSDEIPKGEYLEKFKSMVQAIRERVAQGENKGLSIPEVRTRKIMKAIDSRAIAKDMNQPPFKLLRHEDQDNLRDMCGCEIMTLDQYLIERDKLVNQQKESCVTDFPFHRPSRQNKPFSDQIKEFIQSVTWTYAKTMPDWPHEYIVRYKVDKELFLEMVKHIREFGYRGPFYEKTLTYFEESGKVYWTMGEPLEKTTIINRCREEDTYDVRRKNGTLPEITHK
jgi:hypothetical protein